MMLNEAGEYAIDKNSIVPLTNTKDLLNKYVFVPERKKTNKELKKEKETPVNYVLCGNPDFYTGEVDIKKKGIVPLPGAEQEIININNLLTNSGKTTIQFLKDDVTEDTLHSFKDPKVFHIATHGYFKEQQKGKNEDQTSDLISDPLLYSGLVLYGGGDILNHPEKKYVNFKEGVLTAQEAITLNFDNTELVVLSACETGRGDVEGTEVGEGVQGLQRAFLIAGSDAVIMSLFKVNDEVTQKLMLSFYDKWIKTGDKRKSFIEAKREIKKEYDSPIYWGAFIMIEGKPQGAVNNQP
jgi:CHAT domain-containing protein